MVDRSEINVAGDFQGNAAGGDINIDSNNTTGSTKKWWIVIPAVATAVSGLVVAYLKYIGGA